MPVAGFRISPLLEQTLSRHCRHIVTMSFLFLFCLFYSIFSWFTAIFTATDLTKAGRSQTQSHLMLYNVGCFITHVRCRSR